MRETFFGYLGCNEVVMPSTRQTRTERLPGLQAHYKSLYERL